MPELSRFGGMVIYMLFMDTKQHNKPHVHVYYGDYEAAVASTLLPNVGWRLPESLPVPPRVTPW